MRMIKELESVITQMLSNSKTLIPTIQLGILGAITAILQYNRDNKTISKYDFTNTFLYLPYKQYICVRS